MARVVNGRAPRLLTDASLQTLLDTIRDRGYELIGPTVRDGAVAYEPIDGVEDLPTGWIDRQQGGHYRLERSGDEARFGVTVGPHTWKRYLYPPETTLWAATRDDAGLLQIEEPDGAAPARAFVGVRPCELAAIRIQDRIFLDGEHVDPTYRAHRANAVVIAVQCRRAAGTCFCASMGTGPRAEGGYDLALTERVADGCRDYLLEVGSDLGVSLIEGLEFPTARAVDLDEARAHAAEVAASMPRRIDPLPARHLLERSLDHPRWDATATRCFGCGNCTMVCPTCFCSTVDDVTDLSGRKAERRRRWDSCFNQEFTYIHGGAVRDSLSSRYRHWITHKLSSWHEQFGGAGCVGCGRCITWCPVGIDITEEVAAVAASASGAEG